MSKGVSTQPMTHTASLSPQEHAAIIAGNVTQWQTQMQNIGDFWHSHPVQCFIYLQHGLSGMILKRESVVALISSRDNVMLTHLLNQQDWLSNESFISYCHRLRHGIQASSEDKLCSFKLLAQMISHYCRVGHAELELRTNIVRDEAPDSPLRGTNRMSTGVHGVHSAGTYYIGDANFLPLSDLGPVEILLQDAAHSMNTLKQDDFGWAQNSEANPDLKQIKDQWQVVGKFITSVLKQAKFHVQGVMASRNVRSTGHGGQG